MQLTTMLRWTTLLVVIFTTVHAGLPRPEISVSLDSIAGEPKIGSLSPSLQWNVGKTVGAYDLDVSGCY